MSYNLLKSFFSNIYISLFKLTRVYEISSQRFEICLLCPYEKFQAMCSIYLLSMYMHMYLETFSGTS